MDIDYIGKEYMDTDYIEYEDFLRDMSEFGQAFKAGLKSLDRYFELNKDVTRDVKPFISLRPVEKIEDADELAARGYKYQLYFRQRYLKNEE